MAKNESITLCRLHEVLDYDSQTGIFRWKGARRSGVTIGSVAGTMLQTGYVHIKIDGVRYLAHRLAWFYLNGAWPPECIDHKFGKSFGNGISNLRPASKYENLQNSRMKKNNKSGYKGVSWHAQSGKWRAEISFLRRKKSLGLFGSPAEAHAAYAEAARQFHGDFAREH